jgi:predicted nucleic acid-binding Zn ribbon protein
MEQLINTLPSILRAAGNSPDVVEAAAIAAWKYVAGESVSRQAVASKLEGACLKVAVSDTIWQAQLQLMRRSLLARLNSTLGQRLVNRLEFHVDAETVGSSPLQLSKKGETTENDVSLELWSAANAIQDKGLRKIFLAAAASRLKQAEKKMS